MRCCQNWLGPHLPRQHWGSPWDFNKRIKQPIKRHAAHLYGRYLEKSGCEFIGITGSAGKTTTKEMLASVLSQGFKTRWTKENIDPVYNIPNTILTTSPGTEKLILEMGVEYPGEMDFYLWLAKPSIGICTSVYWTHTQFFKNIAGVATEKMKLIASLPANGYAVLNKDDASVAKMASQTKAKVIWYSTKDCKISFSNDFRTKFSLKEGEILLPVLGQQFVSLALAVVAVGKLSGLSFDQIAQGLQTFKPLPHRMTPHILENGAILIDDTYNANPLAVKEAIKLIVSIGKKKRKILVLGTMQELGDYEEKGHQEVGELAAKMGFEYLLGLGKPVSATLVAAVRNGLSKKQTYLAPDKKEIVNHLRRILKKDDLVLVKGSLSMQMGEVVEELLK